MYLQGLNLDPEAKDAHQGLRDISMKRKATGGKALGMFDRMKFLRPMKDAKAGMLAAEKVLAYDPGNSDAMEALMKASHKGGYWETTLWITAILFRANVDSPKPDYGKYIAVADVYEALSRFKEAADACQLAQRMKPDDMELSNRIKHLAAKETMKAGGYGTATDFRDSIKDRDTQEKLQAQDKGVQELGVMGKLINDAEGQYRLDPTEPGKLMKLVDALEKTEHPDYEGRALELLDDWYQKTKTFRYRKRAGEIQMRQWRRLEQSQIEYLNANKDDSQAIADFKQFQREKWEFELNEYNLWAENYPTETSFKFYAAERMFRLGKFEESIPLFQNAEADAKFRTKARMYQGRAFYELKFYDEAVDTLDALVKEYANQDDAAKEMRYWAARAHEDRGDTDVAIKLYSAIVRMEFNFRDVQVRIRKLRAAAGGNAAAT